jgi:hypothetical protein
MSARQSTLTAVLMSASGSIVSFDAGASAPANGGDAAYEVERG